MEGEGKAKEREEKEMKREGRCGKVNLAAWKRMNGKIEMVMRDVGSVVSACWLPVRMLSEVM